MEIFQRIFDQHNLIDYIDALSNCNGQAISDEDCDPMEYTLPDSAVKSGISMGPIRQIPQ